MTENMRRSGAGKRRQEILAICVASILFITDLCLLLSHLDGYANVFSTSLPVRDTLIFVVTVCILVKAYYDPVLRIRIRIRIHRIHEFWASWVRIRIH